MTIRAISLWQPWASAVALGLKTIETRGWRTYYTGPIAIHAAKKSTSANRELFVDLLEDAGIFQAFAAGPGVVYNALPFGAVVAVAELEDCVPTDMISHLSDLERMLGDFSPGRFGWIFQPARLRALAEPFPVSGRQGFFFVNLPDRLLPNSP